MRWLLKKRLSFLNSPMSLDSVFILGDAIGKVDIWSRATLALGKNFIPEPRNSSLDSLHRCFEKFKRKIRLKHMFYKEEKKTHDTLYEPNPAFSPKEAPEAIEEYLNEVWADLRKGAESKVHNNTLLSKMKSRHTKAARRYVTRLRKKLLANNLQAAIADKNLGLVVIPTKDYETNMRETLESKSFARVSYSTVKQTTKAIHTRIVQAARTHLRGNGKKPNNLFKFVTAATPANSETPTPYLLYKVHKLSKAELENGVLPPTRLIVPNTTSITRRISRYIDYVTAPIVKRKVPYLLWDSKSLVKEIETKAFKCPCVLQTMDVKALYPSIPIQLGCRFMRQFLTNEMPPTQLEFICDMLELVMENAFVHYKGRWYHQRIGTSMGTSCAVNFANVFLHTLERNIMSEALETDRVLTFKRLIDDIFMVTPHVADAERFAEEYNSLHENINVTHDVGHKVEFLDLLIRRPSQTGYKRLKISLHQKLHNRYCYLPWSSFHPRGAKCGYIKAELMRAIRNSSTAKEFLAYVPVFAKRLRKRGYPLKVIQKAFNTAHYFNRRQYLFGHSRREISTQADRVIFTVPFNPLTEAMDIPKLLRKGWQKVLEEINYDSEWLQPPMVAYKKCTTLATLLKRDRESAGIQSPTDGLD